MFRHALESKYGPTYYLVIHPGCGSAYLAIAYKPERTFRLSFLVYGRAHDLTGIRGCAADNEFLLLRRLDLRHV